MASMKENRTDLDRAMERLSREVLDGLRHGFFELTVVGDTVKDRKRRLTVKAGKTHLFYIPEEELTE